MSTSPWTLSAAAAGAVLLALAACAGQPERLARYVEPGVDIVSLAEWDYGTLQDGFQAEQVIGATARGPDGQRIGEVENLIIGPDSTIRSIVIGTDEDFLRPGGTVIAVPWRSVSISEDLGSLSVPVTAANVRSYSLFRDRVATDAGSRTWKATDLLDDYVRLRGGIDYGWVNDLIFSRDGRLRAVVVASDIAQGPGLYAFPFDEGPGFDPWIDTYPLPYGLADVGTLDLWDPDLL